jgi:K+-transporting ATPase KdpF subunit
MHFKAASPACLQSLVTDSSLPLFLYFLYTQPPAFTKVFTPFSIKYMGRFFFIRVTHGCDLFRRFMRICGLPRLAGLAVQPFKGGIMIVLISLVAAVLIVYLFYALFKPERF